MSESLPDRLNRIRRRVRGVLWLYGLSWIVAVLCGTMLVVGLFDWLLHLDDPGVRLIVGLGILAATGWLAWRTLIAPLLRPLSDVELALRIERRFPALHDSLASTVQFLESGTDPRLGSAELQQRVIGETLGTVEHLDVSDVIQTRDVRRVAAAALGICLVVAVVAVWNPSEATIAVRRLVSPFSANPWPRTTELRLVHADLSPIEYHPGEPLQMVRGDTLKLFVANAKGGLPDDAVIEYHFPSDELSREPLRRTTLRGSSGQAHEVGAATLLLSRGPIRFRALGGDDDTMPLYTLQVVPPPTVDDLQIELTPPAYTGREPKRLPKGVGHVQGLLGTRVAVRAGVNKPLAAATLRVKNQPPHAIDLPEKPQTFRTSFLIEEAGTYSYWFELKDRQGFENPEAPRYEIRGMADLVPEIYIDKPATDLQVTAEALVPLRFVAKDDLGLKQIRLLYKSAGTEALAEQSLVLHEGKERPEQLAVEYPWELAPMSLSPGMRLVFHGEADDDYNLGEEHVGRSLSRTLTVVSPADKLNELASRQAGLLEGLERVVESQGQARNQVGELRLQLDKAGKLRPEDLDLLKRIELDQRRISSQLLNPADGIEAEAKQLLDELKNNRLDNPEMELRLGQIVPEMERLKQEHLPNIEQQLTQARKEALAGRSQSDDQKPADDTRAEQVRALAEAHDHQSAVLESLEAVRDQLAQWRHRRDLTGDLNDVIARQEAVNRESAEVGRNTLSKSPAELTPQEQADLARLAARQNQQAERIDEFDHKLDETAKSLAETSPALADLLRDAHRQMSREALAGRMREAAEQLKQNQVGEAANRQQQVLEQLHELQNLLANRTDSDAETVLRKLKEAESELELLKKQQQELLRKVPKTEQRDDPQQQQQELQRLSKRQQELRERVSWMARRLRRLQAQQAGDSAGAAADTMRHAQQNLDQNDRQQAAGEQQQALKQLEQAQQKLAEARQRAEERLAQELLERIADDLKDMIARQQNVIDETGRLDEARKDRGNWSRAQLKSLRDLAEVQRGLKQETDGLVKKIKAAEVFALALEGASRYMDKAAQRLTDRKTDVVTLRTEQAAKQRFVDLTEALKADDGQPNQQPPGDQQQQPSPDEQGPPTDTIPQLAQLKMLKTLQQDLLQRTGELDQLRRDSGRLTDEQRTELDALAQEQGQLADLARNLARQLMQGTNRESSEQQPSVEPKGDTKNPKSEIRNPKQIQNTNLRNPQGTDVLDIRNSDLFRISNSVLRISLTAPQTAPTQQQVDPLERAIEGMRSAHERIAEHDTGTDTRNIQQTVVDELDKLIDLARQQQLRPSRSSQQNRPQAQQNQQQQQTDQSSQSQDAAQTGTGQPKGTGQPNQQPQNSQQRAGTSSERDAELIPRRQLLKEVWGHLPERLRQKLLNVDSEQYLPQYDALIRRYFEALAKQNQSPAD